MERTEPARMVLVTTDPLVHARLVAQAGEWGLEIASEGAEHVDVASVVAVDLEAEGAVGRIAGWRRRWPEALIAGYVSTPRPELWLEAEGAGCDLVTNRGSFVLALRRRLATWQGRAGRRFPLFSSADVAGRLGVVFRTQVSPVGPLAVYRVAGGLVAASDACPHAGATLSEGELDGPIVTCPRHGSRFDVRTGERLRGPADLPLRIYRLLEEAGHVYLSVE